MRRGIYAIGVVLMALMVATTPAAAVSSADLNYGENGIDNPYVSADVTVDSYDVGYGDTPQYEDDSGSVTDLPASVNSSSDVDDLGTGYVNEWTFTATDIDFADAGEFPRKSDETDNSASALDASEYTSGANTTVSDVNTAPGVEAVEMDFQAGTSGQSATYSNFSVTSDAEKRYFQAFYDIQSSSASTISVTIHDQTDGDTATVEIYNATGDTSSATVGANTTGEGKVMQVQVGKLSASGGDSTIQEIGQVVVSTNDAANVDFSAINVEKTSKYKLGTKKVDTDDDDELETEEIYSATGPISIHSISTMGTAFDSATIKGVTFPAHFEAQQLSSDDVAFSQQSGEDAGYPNWDKHTTTQYRLELPDAYDLSYANTELRADQKHTETHYKTVQYAEGTGDTAFDDIEDSSWTDITTSFSSEGKQVSIDTTVQPGTSMVLELNNVWTSSEYDTVTSGDQAGGGGPMSSADGGFWGFLTSLPGIIVTGAAAFLGGRSLGVF